MAHLLTSPHQGYPPLLLGLLALFSAFTGVEAAGISNTTMWILISVGGSIALTIILNLICCYCRRRGVNCGLDCCACYCGDPPDDAERSGQENRAAPQSATGTDNTTSTTKVAIVRADGTVIREGPVYTEIQGDHQYEALRKPPSQHGPAP